MLVCPDIIESTTNLTTVELNFTDAVVVTDNVDSDLSFACTIPSPAPFQTGVEVPMSCTATDTSRNQGLCGFSINVKGMTGRVWRVKTLTEHV